MEEEIKVDRTTLKALGADTRINILKHLSSRRMTQAELASAMGLSAPSVNEHLKSLLEADLISQVDSEGRKWKYYELTQKGAAVTGQGRAKIWFLLSLSLVALGVAGTQLYSRLTQPIDFSASIATGAVQTAADAGVQGQAAYGAMRIAEKIAGNAAFPENMNAIIAATSTPPLPPEATTQSINLLSAMPMVETIAVLAAVLALGFCLGLLFKDTRE